MSLRAHSYEDMGHPTESAMSGTTSGTASTSTAVRSGTAASTARTSGRGRAFIARADGLARPELVRFESGATAGNRKVKRRCGPMVDGRCKHLPYKARRHARPNRIRTSTDR